MGGAAVLVNSGEEGTMVHSMRVRESSSYPAELWALCLVLIITKKDTTLIVLSDCRSALQIVAPASTTHTLTPILRKIAQALRA